LLGNIIDEPNAEDVYTTWLLDSSASMHFTPNHFDFASYEEESMMSMQLLHLDKKCEFKEKAVFFFKHNFGNQTLFEEDDNTRTIQISPVYHTEGTSQVTFYSSVLF